MSGLEHVLPDPTPPPGARERVRAGIPRRVARWHRRRAAVVCAGVLAAAACAVAIAGRLHARDERAVTPVGAALSPGVLDLASRARVLVEDGARVALLRDDGAGTVIRLERGTIVCNVAPRAPGRPFVIEAGDVRVEVVGTLFAVGVAADGTVGVRGDEGVVRVHHAGGSVRVGAGESWPDADRAPAIGDAARAGVAFMIVAAAAPQVVAPTAAAPATPTTKPRSKPTPTPIPTPTPTPDPSPALPNPARPPSPYVIARQLEDAGDLTRALAGYRAIRSGPEAEDALYAAGRLLRGAIASPDAAQQTFLDYRRRYPDGRYARAVDLHLLDHAVAKPDHDAVVREADRFLAAHADDPLAPRFRQARAAVRVLRRDCAGALDDLAALPASPAIERLRARCAP